MRKKTSDKMLSWLFGHCAVFGHEPEGPEELIYDCYWRRCKHCKQSIFSRNASGTYTTIDRETLKPIKQIVVDESGNQEEITL